MIGKRVTLKSGEIVVIMGTKPGAYRVKMLDGTEKWVLPEDVVKEK